MGAVNVGSASVTITPTMSGFCSKINKELGSAGTSGGAAVATVPAAKHQRAKRGFPARQASSPAPVRYGATFP